MSGTALLLPGQGSQFVGMGRDLARAFPAVRGLYERADETLASDLSRICWEGPPEELTATENAQPAILLHSYAVWTLVEGAVDEVSVAAGHSLGEFSAHLIAGTFTFEDALRVVRRRGELMAASGAKRPGTMAAVLGLETGEVEAVCRRVEAGVVVAANLNAPSHVVISGDVEAVRAASSSLAEAGARRVVALDVSGAFHSPLMADAADGLSAMLAASTLEDPDFPVVSNASAEFVSSAEDARRALLAQLTSPVRWIESVARMRELGPARWLELGPGNVLSGLLRRIDGELSARSVGDAESVAAFVNEG